MIFNSLKRELQVPNKSKHPEIKAEIAELQGLIKDLEKRSENQRANS